MDQRASGEGQQQPDPAGGKKGVDFRDIPPPLPRTSLRMWARVAGLYSGLGAVVASPWTESRDVDLAVFDLQASLALGGRGVSLVWVKNHF